MTRPIAIACFVRSSDKGGVFVGLAGVAHAAECHKAAPPGREPESVEAMREGHTIDGLRSPLVGRMVARPRV